MKILLTVDTYKDQINGVNNSVNILCSELKKLGHDVRILALSENNQTQKFDDHYYISSKGLSYIYPEVRIALKLDKKIKKEIYDWHPDIIHSQTEFFTFTVAKNISKELQIPHVHTLHTMYEDYYKYICKIEKLSKYLIRKAEYKALAPLKYLIVPSIKVKKEVLEKNNINGEVKIIPTGINLKQFQKEVTEEEKEKLLRKYNIKKNDFILVSVSRIGKEKNIEELIYITKKLVEKNKKVKLLIVGSGPNKHYLEELVKKEKLEKNIIFVGMVKFNEVYKYYKLGNIYVNASTSETQGLTYIEGLSCGLPLICRKDDCLHEVIENDKNGYQYESIEDAVSKIESLIKDKNKIDLMKKNSLEIVNKFSKEIFAKKVYKYYKEIIKKESKE